jgi:hypothetical protein
VSKGVIVEFNGSLFATNLKLQKLNEEAEFKAVLNLCEVSNEILRTALDFNVEATEPIQIDASNDLYQVQYNVNCTTNKNYDIFNDHFSKTAKGISMSRDELKEYQKLNKKVYSIVMQGNALVKTSDVKGNITYKESKILDTIRLRNINSAVALQNFFIRSNGITLNFKIKNDIETLFINPCVSNCTDNRFKISHDFANRNLSRPDEWFLNCIGMDPYGNGISGTSFLDFYFHGGNKMTMSSSKVFYCFVKEKKCRKVIFRYFKSNNF